MYGAAIPNLQSIALKLHSASSSSSCSRIESPFMLYVMLICVLLSFIQFTIAYIKSYFFILYTFYVTLMYMYPRFL